MATLLEKDRSVSSCFMKMTEAQVSFLKRKQVLQITRLGINLLLKTKK